MPRDKRKWRNNIPNLWDTAKVILTGMFIIRINACMKKHDKSQINKLLTPQGNPKEKNK